MASPKKKKSANHQTKPVPVVAIEALWDGDTQGWFIDLYAVVKGDSGYESRYLRGVRRGGDIRLFNGSVPPWPEALEAARVGAELAAQWGVPFHFPSPDHPEDDCPHWWELGESHPCSRCRIKLLQRADCPWRGTCYYCHLDIEREAKEASWSPEERSAPRCSMCGKPAPGTTETPPFCQRCREEYRTFSCPGCGATITAHRKLFQGETCRSCAMSRRLSALSPAELERLRKAAARGTIAGLSEARKVLQCGLIEAQEALALLAAKRAPKPARPQRS